MSSGAAYFAQVNDVMWNVGSGSSKAMLCYAPEKEARMPTEQTGAVLRHRGRDPCLMCSVAHDRGDGLQLVQYTLELAAAVVLLAPAPIEGWALGS
jgi:hypothetical protein